MPPEVAASVTVHLLLRLSVGELAGLDAEAQERGLGRSACLSALVRCWVLGKPTFSRPGELTLIAIQMELRRLGVNLAQTGRVLGAAAIEGRAIDAELARIEEIRREVRGQIAAVRQALEGNLDYWRVDP